MAYTMPGNKTQRPEPKDDRFHFYGWRDPDYNDGHGNCIKKDEEILFSFSIQKTSCCGVHEIYNFEFAGDSGRCENGKLVKAKDTDYATFKEGLDKFFNCDLPDNEETQEFNCAVLQLTITRPKKNLRGEYDPCHQPMLQKYLIESDNCFCAPWVDNPNSSNQIQVWLIYV